MELVAIPPRLLLCYTVLGPAQQPIRKYSSDKAHCIAPAKGIWVHTRLNDVRACCKDLVDDVSGRAHVTENKVCFVLFGCMQLHLSISSQSSPPIVNRSFELILHVA